jgi:CheY-like chemotaxis protein
MPKILIVEDDGSAQDRYEKNLPGFDLVQAETYAEGLRLFQVHMSYLDAIVLDGDLGGAESGWTLAELFREVGFRGPMIAASHSTEYQQKLLEAGCNHQVKWKHDVPDLLKLLFR